MDKKPATYREIVSQAQAWQEAHQAVLKQAPALRRLWHSDTFADVVFTGCGSTYYLSLAAASLWQTVLARPARAIPAGELWLYPETGLPPAGGGGRLLIAVSRSGETSETVAVTERFRRHGNGAVVVITADPDAPLAGLGDITIAIPAAQEESMVQTRSFAAMYVAATALIAALAERQDWLEAMARLPAAGNALIEQAEPIAHRWGEDLDLNRFYFLGSGPRYGLACEANLKMKEMTQSESEAFHFFEFRHGPMSMVNTATAVVGLVSEKQGRAESRVLQEMSVLGGQILSLAPDSGDIALPADLPPAVRNVLYLPPLQLLAYHRTRARGLDPDRPANLSAVIRLDLQP